MRRDTSTGASAGQADMEADKYAALHWLLGREAKPGAAEPPSKGREALIRMLRSETPLDADIREALADLLEVNGASQMKLELSHRFRG
jgi:ethanolamine utilization microcompartment shell protein EutL